MLTATNTQISLIGYGSLAAMLLAFGCAAMRFIQHDGKNTGHRLARSAATEQNMRELRRTDPAAAPLRTDLGPRERRNTALLPDDDGDTGTCDDTWPDQLAAINEEVRGRPYPAADSGAVADAIARLPEDSSGPARSARPPRTPLPGSPSADSGDTGPEAPDPSGAAMVPGEMPGPAELREPPETAAPEETDAAGVAGGALPPGLYEELVSTAALLARADAVLAAAS